MSLSYVPAGRPYDFGGDLFPQLLAAGRPLAGLQLPGYILDIGSPERYLQAEADWQIGRFVAPG
ncbi:MAG TPA: hypothetical protein VHL09_02365 [Dehalococcoidia bacterium]|nr:hypothetical protein [Dehalococcoidia bacterium]